MNIIIGLLVGGVFFMSTIKAYTLGLKHGKTLYNGNIPKLETPLVQPIKKVIQHFEGKKTEKKIDSIIGEYWER